MNDSQTTDPRKALAAAYLVRSEARARLAAAAAALDRGRRIEQDAHADLSTTQAVELETEAAHASRLHASIVAGADEAQAAVLIDDSRRRRAETRLSIARKAVEPLTRLHADLLAAAQAAERNLVLAVDATLNAEAEAVASEFWKAKDHLMRLGQELVGMIPEGIDSPTYVALSPSIQRAVEYLNAQRDDLNTPANELRYGPYSHGRIRSKRRAELIAGGDDNAAIADTVAA